MNRQIVISLFSLFAVQEVMAATELTCKKSEIAAEINVSNFWENEGFFVDGSPKQKVRTNNEDYNYKYNVLLNFVELSGNKERPREISLDIPTVDNSGKKVCISTLTDTGKIKDLKVKVIATAIQPDKTNKLYVYGKDIKTMNNAEIGKKARVKITKDKKEFSCAVPAIGNPVEVDHLTINLEGPKDPNGVRYSVNSVSRSLLPFDPHFEEEKDPSVETEWWGTTLVPVQCEVKVTTE